MDPHRDISLELSSAGTTESNAYGLGSHAPTRESVRNASGRFYGVRPD
ncbi:hypothetical protein [Natrinema salinisoli]|nr:hypothetical protein [Natrinema salinisoli]